MARSLLLPLIWISLHCKQLPDMLHQAKADSRVLRCKQQYMQGDCLDLGWKTPSSPVLLYCFCFPLIARIRCGTWSHNSRMVRFNYRTFEILKVV
uniref:Secreted protein n=1 Tax=Oryza brachyantha TaxID=4533 RepID=J3KVV1_ORYBR